MFFLDCCTQMIALLQGFSVLLRCREEGKSNRSWPTSALTTILSQSKTKHQNISFRMFSISVIIFCCCHNSSSIALISTEKEKYSPPEQAQTSAWTSSWVDHCWKVLRGLAPQPHRSVWHGHQRAWSLCGIRWTAGTWPSCGFPKRHSNIETTK